MKKSLLDLLVNLSTAFLLASLATLSFKNPVLLWALNANDVFLLLSLGFLAIFAFLTKQSITFPRKALLVLFAVIASIVLGTVVSVTVFGVFPAIAVREYLRLFACIATLFLVWFFGKHTDRLMKRIILALAFPSLLLPFFLFSSQPLIFRFLDESKTRLTLFLVDPNYLASFLILQAFILIWITFAQPFGRKIWISAVSAILFSLTAGSILWSGSRGGVIGFLFSIILFLVFALWKLPFRKGVATAAVVVASLAGSYFILPDMARDNIVSRSGNIIDPTASNPFQKFASKQGRSEIWENAFMSIKTNPLGYGLGYHETTDIREAGTHHRIAHNTILEAFLTGGIVLGLVLAACLIVLTKKTVFSKLPFSGVHYFFFALTGTLGSSLFLDSLLSRWIWVAIGIVLAFLSHPEETPSLSDAPARLP